MKRGRFAAWSGWAGMLAGLLAGVLAGVLLASCNNADLLVPYVQPSRLILGQHLRQDGIRLSFNGLLSLLPNYSFWVQYSRAEYNSYFDSEGVGRLSSAPTSSEKSYYAVYWSITRKGDQENLLSVTNVPRMFSPVEPLGGIRPGRIYLGAKAYFYPNIQIPSGTYTITAHLSDGARPRPHILDKVSCDIFIHAYFEFPPDLYLLGKGALHSLENETPPLKALTPTPLHIDADDKSSAYARLRLAPGSFTANQDRLDFGSFSLSDPAYSITAIRAVTGDLLLNIPPLRKPDLYPWGHQKKVEPPVSAANHVVELKPVSAEEIARVLLEVADPSGQIGTIYLLIGL